MAEDPPEQATSIPNGMTLEKPEIQKLPPQELKVEPTTNEAPKTQLAHSSEAADSVQDDAQPNLSKAELKKRAKAEKAAKRAREKTEKGSNSTTTTSSHLAAPKAKMVDGQQRDQKPQPKKSISPQNVQDKGSQKQQPQPVTIPQKNIPIRRRLSASGTLVKTVKHPRKKEVALFGHLYGQARRHSLEGAPKDIHPAILALGLQMSSYIVCGSTARCVSMLLAFKSVVESYTLPPHTAISRHFTPHCLSPQITFLSSCRPLAVPAGNAIRWLKELISKIDPEVSETEAKDHLLSSVDTFIRERITAAGAAIAASAADKIAPGDVILTFSSSSVVQRAFIEAHSRGTPFRVVVIDSKPLFEGRRLAARLAARGIHVQYALVSAAAHIVKGANKVFLGAHAMMSNGRLYSRVGTALIAMLAHERAIPVIVCCESLKFTDRVALDSVVGNEIAPPEELLTQNERDVYASMEGLLDVALPPAAGGKGKGMDLEKENRGDKGILARFEETQNLQILNVLYDVTPAEYINMVVTEYGSLPPSSVPVVHRISTNS